MSEPRRTRIEPGIYRRPDDKLEIGFRDAQGKQRWRTVDGRITAARKALADEHARRNRGERIAANPRLTFPDAAKEWWDARVVKLRPNTQSGYGTCLARLQAPEHFGRRRLTDISPTDVARYVSAARLKDGGAPKGSTLRGDLRVLSSIFTFAARHLGYVGGNPVALLDKVERPSAEDERPKRILNADELGRLLAAVDLIEKSTPGETEVRELVPNPHASYRTLFDCAAETGGRLAEVLGLVWQNVDFEAQTITFTHQLDRAGERVPLKTKRSRRTLEITPALVVSLRALKLASARSGPHDLVFVGRDGTAHDHRNVAGRVLARAVKHAGLEAVVRDGKVLQPAPTFHSLRHSHASALIAGGWDIEEVSARLGHSDVSTTQRTYVHEFDAAGRSADRRSRLSAIYGSFMEASDRSERQQVSAQEFGKSR